MQFYTVFLIKDAREMSGMPQAVEDYMETKNFEKVDRVKRRILTYIFIEIRTLAVL